MSAAGDWPSFDDAVVRAMAKWPDVPCCYGWLTLDVRGNWRIQGEVVRHQRACEFLARHYRGDGSGRWYVQNGPQQVFVDLDYTPWVYRYQPHGAVLTQTGLNCLEVDAGLLDDDGNLLLLTAYGVGVLDDRDLGACAALLLRVDEDSEPYALAWHGRALPLTMIKRADVAARFGFDAQPR